MRRDEALRYAVGIEKTAPVLFAACSWHKTHKNEPIDFETYPYLKQIYAEDTREIGVMKSTQCGVSEYLLCRVITLINSGRNVFYVLPNDKLIGRFVRERFDKTVSFTPRYLRALNGGDGASNVTMKQMGGGTVVFVGSNSTSGFTEFPADDAVIDETDRCDQKNLLMVDDRMANSRYRTKLVVGQPTIEEFGIHRMWQESKQWSWFLKCPRCGKWFHPDFLKHVVAQEGDGRWAYIDPDYDPSMTREPGFYHTCGQLIDRKAGGVWVAKYPNREVSCYHVGKEFSTMVTLRELCKAFSAGLDDDAAMMRFYNSDLGLPYTPVGSKIVNTDLDDLVADYIMPQECSRSCIMGVDVGVKIHIIINEILPDGIERMVFCNYVKEKEDVIALTQRYNIVCGVIDAQPETRLARDICTLPQFFKCFFHSAKSIDKADPNTKIVTVNRTEILDAVLAKVREKRWILPRNAASIPEFYDHMKANTRVFNQDMGDSGVYDWIGSAPDHLMFAAAYATLARRILGSLGVRGGS